MSKYKSTAMKFMGWKGFAFVYFATVEDANVAAAALSGG
jgi:hypothetical protein